MKRIKGILSILLTAVLLACSISIAASADSEIDEAANYPLLKMTGSWGDLFEMKDDGKDGAKIFNAGTGFLELVTDEFTAELLERAKALDLDGVVDMVVDTMTEYFGPIAMDKQGNSINKVGRYANNGIKHTDGAWYFNFDWRLDPMDLADQLDAYINEVLAKEAAAGNPYADKVNISCLSGSGQVLMSYVAKYGSGKLASAVFNLTLQNGTSFFGDLFKGDITINADIIGKMDRIILMGNPVALGDMIPWIGWLYEPGILSVAAKLVTLLGGRLIDRVYEEALLPMMFHIPGWWAYVPMEDYAAAKKAAFKDNAEYDVLVAKLDRYRDEVMSKQDEIMSDLDEAIKVAVRVSYGNPLLPIGKRAYVQADAMVDTVYASFGATCAPLGSPFNSLYKQKKHNDKNYISPDRMIDASTCLLPDKTWFAFDQIHTTQYDYSGWYQWFLETKNPTVFTSEAFPQYVEFLAESNSFAPLEAKETTWKDTLAAIGYWLLKAWRWILLLPLFWI